MPASHHHIQLMRPALLTPFLAAMDIRGLDAEGLMEGPGLNRASIIGDHGYVSATHVHQFIARVAESVNDPYFCWQLGWNLKHRDYPLFADLVRQSQTLSDLFTEMAVSSALHASASSFELHIAGPYSQFRGARLYRPGPQARYTDAFTAAAFTSLIALYAGEQWSAKHVTIEISDPNLIPTDSKLRRAQSTSSRLNSTTFPTAWLLAGRKARHKRASQRDIDSRQPSLIQHLQHALAPHLADSALNARHAADLCGLNLHQVNQQLALEGTSLAKVIDNLRREMARRLVSEGELSIAAVGLACGYPDASSFSRTFQRWEGISAKEFRLENEENTESGSRSTT